LCTTINLKPKTMKKHILLLAAVCTAFMLKAGDLTVNGHGGGGDSKLTIGISVGAGIPMGDLGNKTRDTVAADSNKAHGFANTGFHFNASASYIFAGPLGVMVSIGGNMNSFDGPTYTSVNKYPSGESATGTSYYIGEYLVGPCLSLGQSSLKINIHALVGLVTANAPTVTTTFSGGSVVSSQPSTSGFGYNFGAGIKYNFNEKMGLLVDLGYTGATETYTGYTYVQNYGSSTLTTTNNGHKAIMNVGIFTATVGIAFNL